MTRVVLLLTLVVAVAAPSFAGASGPKPEKAIFPHGADGYTSVLSGGAPESAAFGVAGPEVATIKMKMSEGGPLEIHPRFPPMALRRKYVWMRGFRYFIWFYPGSTYVSEYWLYDRAGRRVGCNNYADGGLGASVCGGPPPFEG